ncbi:MAG: GAF domain-containing protein [Chloroflexi bacterium]|nr:MAG: GAF domain-containing protein [Chloroflexota bacterium]
MQASTEQTIRGVMPDSIWQLLEQIDATLDTDSPLAEQLMQINEILLNALPIDAVWCQTVAPLAYTACGLLKNERDVPPHIEVSTFNQALALPDGSPEQSTLLTQVLSRRTPQFFATDSTAPHLIDADLADALFAASNTKAVAVLPFTTTSTIWGAMVVGLRQSSQPQKLAADTQQLLSYLSKHVARGLQRTFLLEGTRRHTETAMMLHHIAQTITSSLDIDTVLQKTMTGINNILDVEAGSLLLLDPTNGELYFKLTLRGENKQITSYRLQPGEGIAGWVVANNHAVIVNSVAQDPRFSSKIDKAIGFKTKAVMCVPLLVQGKPIGALEVLNKRRGPFNHADLDLLVSMSASLGVALTNATLFDQVSERVRQTEIINQVTTRINAGHGLSETAEQIHHQFSALFPLDHLGFSLIDSSSAKVRQWTFTEHGSIEYKQPAIAAGQSRLQQLLKTNRGQIFNKFTQLTGNSRYPDDDFFVAAGLQSQLIIPLQVQDTSFGALSVGSQQENAYSRQDLELLQQLAPHLAVVIEKALLLDNMAQSNYKLHLLNRLSEMLVSTVDFQLIVETALNMLPRVLPNDVHGIVVEAEDGVHVGMVLPFAFNNPGRIQTTLLDKYAEMTDRRNLKVLSEKVLTGNLPVSADWQQTSTMTLPLLIQQGTNGLIFTASNKTEAYNDDFYRIFSLLASQISAAVENAHLFHQVEQERARLAAILASTTDAVLVVNRNGRIVLDNPSAWEILGVQESQRGRRLANATSLESLVSLFEGAMRGDETTGEIPLEDGRTYFANLSPVSVGGAGVIGWVATMQDVSHFKELDDLKNEFVSTVSHDLQSPLSGILIASQMVGQVGDVNETQRRLLNVVERRVKSMSNLIDDLLDVGQIEAGIDMEMTPTRLNDIVEDAVHALEPEATEKGIELAHTIAPDVPAVLGNNNRLRQVVFNLVSNALKYTPGPGQVNVALFCVEREVRLQVSDTGLGIPSGDQPHIFEKFYRVKGDHALEIKGTGLGLAIVKSIVEQHHGRIWLESVFGEGTTFTVALPAHRPDNAQD